MCRRTVTDTVPTQRQPLNLFCMSIASAIIIIIIQQMSGSFVGLSQYLMFSFPTGSVKNHAKGSISRSLSSSLQRWPEYLPPICNAII